MIQARMIFTAINGATGAKIVSFYGSKSWEMIEKDNVDRVVDEMISLLQSGPRQLAGYDAVGRAVVLSPEFLKSLPVVWYVELIQKQDQDFSMESF